MPHTRQLNARFLQTELEIAQTHLQHAAELGSPHELSQYRAIVQRGYDTVLRHLSEIPLEASDRRCLQRQAATLQAGLQAADELTTLRAHLAAAAHAKSRTARAAHRCRTVLHKTWPLLVGLSGAVFLYRAQSSTTSRPPAVSDNTACGTQE